MKKQILSFFFILFLMILQLPRAVAQPKNNKKVLPKKEVKLLANLINQRLTYMKDVAAYKWVNKIPIEDLEREKVVIENSLKSAEAYELDGPSTQTFFETQITLAKMIQQYWFDEWEKKGFTPYEYADLTTVIRPALIALGDDILKAIKEFAPWQYSEHQQVRLRSIFFRGIEMEGISLKAEKELFKAVKQIKLLK